MNIKILVAAHKPYWMPEDDVYLPIQVGAAGKESLGWQRDDEGDNISNKNPNYCELTALYWAWKNLDADYIGLCHYRRYFSYGNFKTVLFPQKSILRRDDYVNILGNNDVLVPRKFKLKENTTVYMQYNYYHHVQDLEKVRVIIRQKVPQYLDAFDFVMNESELRVYNMFVMSKSLFMEYCEWLFMILFTLEKRIDISCYDSYQKRVFGFLSERLFNVWIQYKYPKMYEVDVISLEDKFKNRLKTFLKSRF